MFSYTKLNVNTVSFIITLFIYSLINLLPINFDVLANQEEVILKVAPVVLEKQIEQSSNNFTVVKENTANNKTNTVANVKTNTTVKTKNNTATNTVTNTISKTEQTTNKKVEEKKNAWRIVIPSINLDAPIAEGTSVEVMNSYVGHFSNTPKLNGNVALGAHNRGYPVNYFQNIKKLKKGDLIKYIYNNVQKEYVVETVTVIKETDWTYLANTKDDRITLITCVENEPEYRRCIQGKIKM